MNISYNVTSQYIYINTSVVPVHIYMHRQSGSDI